MPRCARAGPNLCCKDEEVTDDGKIRPVGWEVNEAQEPGTVQEPATLAKPSQDMER